MTNFKIGQNVVCTKTLDGFVVKDKIYNIKDMLVCQCGVIAIDYGMPTSHDTPKWTCHICHNIYRHNHFRDYYLCSTFFAPLIYSYNSATSEIIEKFKLTEERSDVKPLIKIEEHEKV